MSKFELFHIVYSPSQLLHARVSAISTWLSWC